MNGFVVVGGCGGLGRMLARLLAAEGCEVCVMGREDPCEAGLRFVRFNLLSDGVEALEREVARARGLIVTAGAGRVAPFGELTQAEVARAFRLNAEGMARLLRAAWPRLAGEEDFYCAVLGSIAGLLPSPMMAAYGAAKASVAALTASLNAELAQAASPNRILGVYPGHFEGTGFDGGADQPEKTREMAAQVLARMRRRETKWIPRYEEVYRDVLARAQADPEGFALESCRYKLASGRLGGGRREKRGFLSGTFDLFHIGHLNLLRRAKQYCDHLVVGVHPEGSKHKSKPIYIPLEERMEIVRSCRYVDEVVVTLDEDDAMYPLIHYDYLFVGSDYKGTERFNRYERALTPLGVKIVYFPYTQGTSSTQLRQAIDAAAPTP